MPTIITIPTPCHEDWNAMTPNNKGRHCDSCAKTVVDFTTSQPQEILMHFKTHKNVCGRFTTEQLNEPIPTQEDFVRQIAYFKVSTLKKVAAIFLFAFMIGASSCNENAQGKTMVTSPLNDTTHPSTLKGDTNIIEPLNVIAGGISVVNVIDTPKKTIGRIAFHKIPKPVLPIERTMTMGEPAMIDTTINIKPTCPPKKNDNMIVGKIRMEVRDSVNKK